MDASSDGYRIQSEDLRKLGTRICRDFADFERKYEKRFERRALTGEGDARTVSNRDWTCFLNGKAQGLHVPGWRGVIPDWASDCFPRATVTSESWYRVDHVVWTGSDWWSGKYRLLLAFEQENNPKEIKGHTRALFDLAVPDKVLLIWTLLRDGDEAAKELIDKAKDVEKFCKHERIPNTGRIWVAAGSWKHLVRLLEGGGDANESWLEIDSIEPTSYSA